MLFTSLSFFWFLPLVLLVTAGLPGALRWIWLLVASWAFYGSAHPGQLAFLGAVTAVVCACAAAQSRVAAPRARRLWLAAGLVILLGALAALKFYDFLAGEVEVLLAGPNGPSLALPRLGMTAPAGFSFYVFSGASYLIDCHVGRVPGPARAGPAALYLAWFPKILAGPIERAAPFLAQTLAPALPTAQEATRGLQLLGWGLIKKVVIADNLAPLVDHTFRIVAYATPIDLLCSAYFFAFQIYCDFSGYTDAALGISLLFGLRLGQNFRRPYLAPSTAEFWARRWHVSLAAWFRDYLYIPLGGSRAGSLRQYANSMLVFIVSGLWHAGLGYGVGWSFLVWGLLNGAYQWAGIATRPLWQHAALRLPRVAGSAAWRTLRILFTFHLILVSWIFFRAPTLTDAWRMLARIAANAAQLPAMALAYPYTSEQGLGMALIGLLLAVEVIDERRPLLERMAALPAFLRWSLWYLGIFVLLVLGRWQTREFIYMQF